MKKYYDDHHQLDMEISDAEDDSMRIKLYQPIGVKEITVTKARGKEIIELSRIEYNDSHHETRRHISLEAYDPYGVLVKNDADPSQEVISEEGMDKLHRSISQLTSIRRKLLMKKFWDDMKQIDIARDEGISKMAITKHAQTIRRRLKKTLQK